MPPPCPPSPAGGCPQASHRSRPWRRAGPDRKSSCRLLSREDTHPGHTEPLTKLSTSSRAGKREDGSPLTWGGKGGGGRDGTPAENSAGRPRPSTNLAATELPCAATPRCCPPPPSRLETGLRRGALQQGAPHPGGGHSPSRPYPPALSAPPPPVLTHRSGDARGPPPSKRENPAPLCSPPLRPGARHRQPIAIQDGGGRPAARRTRRRRRAGEGSAVPSRLSARKHPHSQPRASKRHFPAGSGRDVASRYVRSAHRRGGPLGGSARGFVSRRRRDVGVRRLRAGAVLGGGGAAASAAPAPGPPAPLPALRRRRL